MEDRSAAVQWLEQHDRSFDHFIGGDWIPPANSTFLDSIDPSSGDVLAKFGLGSKVDVDSAVLTAQLALTEWQELGGKRRSFILYEIARRIQRNARLFAVLESLDNGKPIRETRDIDIPLVVRHFYYHAGWADSWEETFPTAKPVGVCGQIIPWNFPLLMLAWKVAPALATGNTVVLKPAEQTSLTALLFAEICRDSGLPAGVLNIVMGDGSTGQHIVEHPGIDKIAFTGSTEVGRLIRIATAGTAKKLSLELGGKSPFIVFSDADLDSAVEGLVDAIWFNQGQVCCAGSRLLVQESVAEKLYGKIRNRMEKLRVGPPLDKSTDIGAIISGIQLERITSLVSQGIQEGAESFTSCQTLPGCGFYYPPTLLTNVQPASTVAQVEIFGPVLVAMTFRTPKEAVELANNTPYGLAASVWTENVSLVHDVAANLKAGTVWVNCTNQFDAASEFGGYRESGFGREGGPSGLQEYLKFPAPAEKPLSGPDVLVFELDRTHKNYIGGKQVRPDSGYSVGSGDFELPRGNRKDIRNAVEAARAAQGAWGKQTAHARAQILYYLAENLQPLGDDDAVMAAFEAAARCDKLDGQTHRVATGALCYSLLEPIGVIGIVCPEHRPLASVVELGAAAVAMGNTVVILPAEKSSVDVANFYRILEASDFPSGVWNIVFGKHTETVPALADHQGVDALWYFGASDGRSDAERRSVGNLKQVWAEAVIPEIFERLRHAVQVKNVWVPYGS